VLSSYVELSFVVEPSDGVPFVVEPSDGVPFEIEAAASSFSFVCFSM